MKLEEIYTLIITPHTYESTIDKYDFAMVV